ncbi:MAG: hypothetical protein ACYTFM_05585, partial [Planctomycetota bacterium]
MVENKQILQNRVQRPVARPSDVSTLSLTPKDILDIVRRHMFLIICFTIFGFIVGGASWFLLRRY